MTIRPRPLPSRLWLAGVSLTVLAQAAPLMAGGAMAEDAVVQLNELSVEATAAPSPGGLNLSAGDGGTAATSGGGGGPSGVTGYTARVSTAATKTNTPLIEAPQSVSVVTREQLNDRNVQTFTDAVNYVPGAISARSGFDPRFDQIFIRGFDVLTTRASTATACG